MNVTYSLPTQKNYSQLSTKLFKHKNHSREELVRLSSSLTPNVKIVHSKVKKEEWDYPTSQPPLYTPLGLPQPIASKLNPMKFHQVLEFH